MDKSRGSSCDAVSGSKRRQEDSPGSAVDLELEALLRSKLEAEQAAREQVARDRTAWVAGPEWLQRSERECAPGSSPQGTVSGDSLSLRRWRRLVGGSRLRRAVCLPLAWGEARLLRLGPPSPPAQQVLVRGLVLRRGPLRDRLGGLLVLFLVLPPRRGCSNPPFCLICRSDGHLTVNCMNRQKPPSVIQFGLGLPGCAFFALDSDLPVLTAAPSLSNAAIVSLYPSPQTTGGVCEAGLVQWKSDWSSFLGLGVGGRFASGASFFCLIMEFGVLIEKPVEVDMESLNKVGPARIKIWCVDPLCVHGAIDVFPSPNGVRLRVRAEGAAAFQPPTPPPPPSNPSDKHDKEGDGSAGGQNQSDGSNLRFTQSEWDGLADSERELFHSQAPAGTAPPCFGHPHLRCLLQPSSSPYLPTRSGIEDLPVSPGRDVVGAESKRKKKSSVRKFSATSRNSLGSKQSMTGVCRRLEKDLSSMSHSGPVPASPVARSPAIRSPASTATKGRRVVDAGGSIMERAERRAAAKDLPPSNPEVGSPVSLLSTIRANKLAQAAIAKAKEVVASSAAASVGILAQGAGVENRPSPLQSLLLLSPDGDESIHDAGRLPEPALASRRPVLRRPDAVSALPHPSTVAVPPRPAPHLAVAVTVAVSN
nr:ankyrin repeat domain-containing protein 17-like [Triticum aestivum]